MRRARPFERPGTVTGRRPRSIGAPALALVAALAAPVLLAGCDSDDPPGPLPREDVRGVDELRPYRPDGPWAPVLAGCAIVDEPVAACTLETLPFIAQATDAPNVDDVLDRTLVTHDWMGERFEALLRDAPEDLVRLFGATTSIAIGSTVRPSNYWIGTGAIQLDPADLWLTAREKASVATTPDFRAPFARRLAFRNEWAQRVDGRPIAPASDLEDRRTRTLDDVRLPFASVMYHELAHANDFLPPGEAAALDPSARPLDALIGIADRWLSTRLVGASPLDSLILQRLARVRFLGGEPTASEAAIGPVVSGAEMAGDGALIFYAYSTIHEDFATLFEAAMMKARHDVDFHVAFTDVPPDPGAVRCADLTVGWGVRNRLGDAGVNVRAGLAVASVYPDDAELADAVAGALGTQESMPAGTNWCDNVGATVAEPVDGPAGPDGSPSPVAPRLQGTDAGALAADDVPTGAATEARAAARPPEEPVSHETRHAIVDARRRLTVR